MLTPPALWNHPTDGFKHWKLEQVTRGGHPTNNSKTCELNYRVHFIHWRKNYYKSWIYHTLQLMLEMSLYVKHGIGKTLIFFK